MKGKASKLAILLAVVLTLVSTFGVTAFADDPSVTITKAGSTVTVTYNDGEGHISHHYIAIKAEPKTYDGKPYSNVKLNEYETTDPLPDGVTVKAELDTSSIKYYGADSPTNVGDYSVTADVITKVTYGQDSSTYTRNVGVGFKINKAEVDYKIPKPVEGLVYDEDSHALVSGGSNNLIYDVRTWNGSSWDDWEGRTDVVPEKVYAGKYQVWWRVVYDADNYNTPDPIEGYINVEISKKKLDTPVLKDAVIDYTGEEIQLIDAVEPEIGTAVYSVNGSSWSTTVPAATEAGDYEVSCKVEGDENYVDSDVATATITIDDEPELTAYPTAAGELTYSGVEQALLADEGVVHNGHFRYQVRKDGGAWSSPTTIEPPKAKDAGTYEVWCGFYDRNDTRVPGDAGKIVTTVIKKADPIATTPVASDGWTYNGNEKSLLKTEGALKDFAKADGLELVYQKYYEGATDNWTSIPPTGKYAGDYKVFYKVYVPDGVNGDNYLIDETKTLGPITVAKRGIDFEAEDLYRMYPYKVNHGDFDYYVYGIAYADKEDDVISSVMYAEPAAESKPELGEHVIKLGDITLTEFGEHNYKVEDKYDGTLTIYPGDDNVLTILKDDLTYGDQLGKADITAKYGIDKAEVSYSKKNSGEWKPWNAEAEATVLPAGDYVARIYVPEGTGYTEAYAYDDFTVAKVKATITLQNPEFTYDSRTPQGQHRPSSASSEWVAYEGVLPADRSAFRNGVTITPAMMQDAGEYELDATYSGEVFDNYDVTVVKGSVVINSAEMRAVDEDYNKPYDAAKHTFPVTAQRRGHRNPDNWHDLEEEDYTVYYCVGTELTDKNYLSKGQTNVPEFKDVTNGEQTVFYYVDSQNYTPVKGNYTVNITPVELTVSGKTVNATYGTLVKFRDTDEYVTYSGFVGSDTKSVLDGSLTFNYGGGYNQFSNVGTYTVSLGGLTSDNYKIKYDDGSIKVEPKNVKVKWSKKDFTDEEDGVYTATYDGKRKRVDCDVEYGAENATDNKVYSRDDDDVWADAVDYYATDVKRNEDWTVGTYTAKAELTTGRIAANYKLVDDTEDPERALTHKFRIDPVELILTPNKVTTVYGEDAVANGYTAAGLVNDEKQEDVVLGDPVYSFYNADGTTEYAAGDAVGSDYIVKIGVVADPNTTATLHAQNYTVSAANGQMEVTPATITVTAKDQTINYGQDYDKSAKAVTYKGWKGTDDESVLTTKPVLSSNYFVNAKAGAYTLKASGAAAKNYTFKYVDGKLTVNDVVRTLVAQGKASGKKAVVVSWNSVTGGASYDVYLAKCDTKKKSYSPVYKGTTSGNSFKVKKLKKGTCYKYFVVAKAANGAAIAQSETGHFIAGNVKGKKTNAKSITASTNVVSLNKGGSYVLTTSQAKSKGGKKYKLLNGGHAALTRYISSNPAVATVGYDNGVITGVSGGYCKVYALAVNGMWAEVEVYVN